MSRESFRRKIRSGERGQNPIYAAAGEWVEEYFRKIEEEEKREEVRKKALIEGNRAKYLPILEKITSEFELREKTEVISEELGGNGLVTKRLVTNDETHCKNLKIVYQAQGKKRIGRNTEGEFVVPKGHSTSYGPYGESTSGPPCYYRPGPREELVDKIELRSSLTYPYEYSDSDWGGMVVKHEFEAERDISIECDFRLWSLQKKDLYHEFIFLGG